MIDLYNNLVANGGQIINFLSVVGTIIGFIATLREVRKSRQAVQKALESISGKMLFNEVSFSAKLAQEFRENCRTLRWERAIDKGAQLRVTLASLVENISLTAEEANNITPWIDDVTLVITQIEMIVSGSGKTNLSRKNLDFLNTLELSLIKLESRLKNPMREVHRER